jgi:translation initiation factor IF-2
MPPVQESVAKPKPAAEEPKVVEAKIETPKPAPVVEPGLESEKDAKTVKPDSHPAEIEKPLQQPAIPEVKTPEHEVEPDTVHTKTKSTPIAETEEVADEKAADHKPVTEESPEEEKTQSGQLKVLGKMDLSTLERPSRKKKESKGKAKAEKDSKTETPEVEEPLKAPVDVTADTEIKPAEPAQEVVVPQEKAPESPAAEPIITTKPLVEKESNFMKTDFRKLEGVTILGTMKLPEVRKPEPKKPVASSSDDLNKSKKKKRKRIKKQGEETVQAKDQPQSGQPRPGPAPQRGKPPVRDKKGGPRRDAPKVELTPEDIQRQIKETLQRLSGSGKSKASKHRREKRSQVSQLMAEEAQKMIDDQKIITVTEFVTANELANLMNVPGYPDHFNLSFIGIVCFN